MSYTATLPKRIVSLKPPETAFGFTCFAHMIPPFKPEHTLLLGYGGGTVSELMRKIWGACKITGVDLAIDKRIPSDILRCSQMKGEEDQTK